MGAFFHKTCWLLLCLSSLHCGLAQPASSPTPPSDALYLSGEPLAFITTDKLQQLYLVTELSELIKLSPEGEILFRYSNQRLGELQHVDASNPFSVLLYYPDFLRVIILDRTLNEVTSLSLLDKGYQQVRALGISGDNQIWLFDEPSQSLQKISRDGQLIFQSNPLHLQLNARLEPVFLLERQQEVFLVEPSRGVLVFDVFGKYLQTFPLANLKRIQVAQGRMFYLQEGQLHALHLQTLQNQTIRLPEQIAGLQQVLVLPEFLYLLFPRHLERVDFR
jgi:hypothetical protein